MNTASNKVYVAADDDYEDGFVRIIDGASFTEITTIGTATPVNEIAVNPVSNKAHVPLAVVALLSSTGRVTAATPFTRVANQ